MRVVTSNEGFAGLGTTAGSIGFRAPGASWVGPVRQVNRGGVPSYSSQEVSAARPDSITALFRENSMLDMRTCGQPGTPPCNSGAATSAVHGLAGLGRITNVACSDHTAALDQLENLLGEATRVGVSALEVEQTRTYVARFSGISWQHPWWPSTCDREIANARALYNALANRLKLAGGAVGVPLYPADQLTPPPRDITGTIKTVAIAAAVVAGVVLLFPVVRSIGVVRSIEGRK